MKLGFHKIDFLLLFQRVYPFGPQQKYNKPVRKFIFPREAEIKLKFPKLLNQDSVAEYVLVIATKKKLNIPCIVDEKTKSILIERKKLLEIINNLDRRTWTKHMIAYKIIR